MTYEKHKVTTDALDTLGTIITAEEKRDAIHLAVEPVEAAVPLYAGQHVRLVDGKATWATLQSPNSDGVGIVDPFLDEPVEAGERFWLVVYPRQISSLRHVWEHPDFPPSGETYLEETEEASAQTRALSEAWLREYLNAADCPGFDAVMSVIETGSWAASDDGDYLRGSFSDWGPYIHFDGTDAHGTIPPVFWEHVSIYLGRFIPEAERAEGFSCSC
jgi:hypothetical protein